MFLITVYYTTIQFAVFTCTSVSFIWLYINLSFCSNVCFNYSQYLQVLVLALFLSRVSIQVLWLHCSELCNCYIHCPISRILLHCNTTAGHTSSTLLIVRLSCEFGMGRWEVEILFWLQHNGSWDLAQPSSLRTTSDFLCIYNMRDVAHFTV